MSAVTAAPAYWCSRQLSITVDGPEGLVATVLEKPFARVGSHEFSEISLPDQHVRRRSLYLHAAHSGVFCIDLTHPESPKSVWPHLRSPGLRGWLDPDRPISLGPFRLSARLAHGAAPGDEPLPDLQAKGSAASPFPVVTACVNGKDLGTRVLTRQLTVVGRHASCSMQLTSHSVSAVHCVLFWDGKSLWVVDLLSGNGTLLGDQPVEVARVPLGGRLRLGRVELVYLSRVRERDVLDASGSSAPLLPSDSASAPSVAEPVDSPSPDECPKSEPALAEAAEELERQRAALDARQQEWQRRMRQSEADLADGQARLDARLHALETREAEGLRQQEQTARSLADQADQIARERAEWEAERARQEDDLAARRRDLDAGLAQLASLQAQFESERAAWRTTHDDVEKSLADQADQVARARAEWEARRQQWEAEQARQSQEIGRRLAELEARQEMFCREQERGEAEQERRARELAERQRECEERSAWLTAERDRFESEVVAWETRGGRIEAEWADRAGFFEGTSGPDADPTPCPAVDRAESERQPEAGLDRSGPSRAARQRGVESEPASDGEELTEVLMSYYRKKSRWHRLRERVTQFLRRKP